jgi:hypothetical protein
MIDVDVGQKKVVGSLDMVPPKLADQMRLVESGPESTGRVKRYAWLNQVLMNLRKPLRPGRSRSMQNCFSMALPWRVVWEPWQVKSEDRGKRLFSQCIPEKSSKARSDSGPERPDPKSHTPVIRRLSNPGGRHLLNPMVAPS